MQIPISKTILNDKDLEEVSKTISSGWLVQGPKVNEFETLFANFVGSKNAIAVTSCTSAMHLSLLALGLEKDDEIIVPAFTWISTANVVEHIGAKVVFCDIDLDTFNISIKELESKITEKTKAIIPVHLFGLACNINKISSIAKSRGIHLIEDAACGFGSYLNGQHVGSFGDTGCFSFHPRKSITTGEGGMVTTDSDELAEKIKCLRDHGATISDLQRHEGPKPYTLADHIEAGFNQRMTDIQAALGLSQLKRGQSILSERANIAKEYIEGLKSVNWLKLPSYSSNFTHGFQSFPCIYKYDQIDINSVETIHKERNIFMDYLFKKGISTRPATHAVHMLSFYKDKYNLESNSYFNSYAAANCSISLPLFNGMQKIEIDYIISTVKDFQI
jgi:dTDP-4-amino-4,6-dideoxygalactose transaminase